MAGLWRLVFSSVLAGSITGAGASGAPPKSGGEGDDKPVAAIGPRVKAKLLAERPVLAPGKTAILGLHFAIQPEWHIYSNAISDSGGPPVPEWTLPDGFKVQPILWPAPVRHKLPGDLLDHVYEREVTLLVPIAVPADAKPGTTVKLAAEITWMVCKDVCVIEKQPVSIELPVAAQDAEQVVPDAKFTAARARLPKPVTVGKGSDGEKAGISASWDDTTLKLQVKGAKALTFYPLADSMPPRSAIADCMAVGDTLTIPFEPGSGGTAKAAPAHGVLEIKRSGAGAPETGVEFFEVSIPQPGGR